MAGMAAEEPQRKKPRPARLDEAARDAVDDDQYATNRREQLKKAPAENKAAGDGEGVSYVDGRAVVDRSQKKRIAKLAPADHRRSYDDVESCFIPGGLEAWNSTHRDASSVAGSATAPTGGSVKPAPSFAAMFAAPKASWLLKGAARAGLERPTAVQAATDGAGSVVWLRRAGRGRDGLRKDAGVRLAPVGPRRRAGGVARFRTRGLGRGPDAVSDRAEMNLNFVDGVESAR